MSRSPEKPRVHPPPLAPAPNPPLAEPQLIEYTPELDALYKRGYQTIREMVFELEDENNMIAYQIAKTRRRIEAARAQRAAQAAGHHDTATGERLDNAGVLAPQAADGVGGPHLPHALPQPPPHRAPQEPTKTRERLKSEEGDTAAS